MKEESSYLPDTVIPEKIEKKKIVKKVRFHDDNPVTIGQQEIIPKVGTKRLLRNDDSFDQHPEDIEEEEAALLEQECEKDFEKIEQKREAKRQRTEETLIKDIMNKQIQDAKEREAIYGGKNLRKKTFTEDTSKQPVYASSDDEDWDMKRINKKKAKKQQMNRSLTSPAPEHTHGSTSAQTQSLNVSPYSNHKSKKMVDPERGDLLKQKMNQFVKEIPADVKKNTKLMAMISKISGTVKK